MQYLGGKTKSAKRIAATLIELRGARRGDVHVPFAGGLSDAAAIALALGPERDRLLVSDGSAPLVGLYEAWRRGWRPPAIDEARYKDLRAAWRERGDLSPEVVFAGIALSFGGKWMAGYARARRGTSGSGDYQGRAVRSLARKMNALNGVQIVACDFRDVDLGPADCAYCDPLYEGTTGYPIAPPWPGADAFWGWARSSADAGAGVLVSEYAAPAGWVGVDLAESKLGASIGQKTRRDRLWSRG